MSDLIPSAGDGLTMSSREIAVLVEKRHDNVKRTIETLAEQGVIVRPQIEDEPGTDALGRHRVTQVYRFSGERGKRDSIIVVAQLCPEFTARLVDRWQELEARIAQPAIPAQLSRLQLIELAMQAEQERLVLEEKANKLEAKVAEQAPKVAFAQQVEVAPDAIDLGKAAKLIGTGRTRLMAFMREIRWINRFNQPYQDKIEAGLLDVKLGSWEHPDHGLQQSVTTLVSGKGLVKLQSLWDERQHAVGAAHMQPAATQPGSVALA